MSQVMVTVGWVKKGSMNAVVGSGTTSMSLSSMDWKPRMEEPSKPVPSENSFSSNSTRGTVKCCQVPIRSQKRRSIIRAPLSSTIFMTSATVLGLS